MYGVDGVGNGTQIVDNIISARVLLKGSNQVVSQNSIYHGLRCTGSHNIFAANEFLSIAGITLSGSFNIIYNNTVTEKEIVEVYGDRNIIAKNNIGSAIVASGSENFVSANVAWHIGYFWL